VKILNMLDFTNDHNQGFQLMQRVIDDGSHWIFLVDRPTVYAIAEAITACLKKSGETLAIGILTFESSCELPSFMAAMVPKGNVANEVLFRLADGPPPGDFAILAWRGIDEDVVRFVRSQLHIPAGPSWN
jgi:hypothetical protein